VRVFTAQILAPRMNPGGARIKKRTPSTTRLLLYSRLTAHGQRHVSAPTAGGLTSSAAAPGGTRVPTSAGKRRVYTGGDAPLAHARQRSRRRLSTAAPIYPHDTECLSHIHRACCCAHLAPSVVHAPPRDTRLSTATRRPRDSSIASSTAARRSRYTVCAPCACALSRSSGEHVTLPRHEAVSLAHVVLKMDVSPRGDAHTACIISRVSCSSAVRSAAVPAPLNSMAMRLRSCKAHRERTHARVRVRVVCVCV
jgi:hypothetical protein